MLHIKTVSGQLPPSKIAVVKFGVLVKVRVLVRVSFELGGKFSSEAIVLEP